MNSDPASSPVFGWVLFNKFDNALAIYDARGIAIGSFCLNGLPLARSARPRDFW